MELRGRLHDVVRDIRNGDFLLTFAAKEIPSGVDRLPEGDLSISLKLWREKRSLTANAYYWVLVGKIAEVLGQSQHTVHNMLLGDYGQPDIVDGHLVTQLVADTDEAYDMMMSSDRYHARPTSQTVTFDGTTMRVWHEMKGSSLYDTKEMAILIDGATSEARLMGIETLPPEEIERMMGEYEKHHAAG